MECANEQEDADEVFGGVTIFVGLVGTICGGLFLDYIGSTVRNAFKVCCVLPCTIVFCFMIFHQQ